MIHLSTFDMCLYVVLCITYTLCITWLHDSLHPPTDVNPMYAFCMIEHCVIYKHLHSICSSMWPYTQPESSSFTSDGCRTMWIQCFYSLPLIYYCKYLHVYMYVSMYYVVNILLGNGNLRKNC